MEKYIYPAIYHEADDGGYWVSFPDFSGVYTQGASLEETYDMCVDCLGLTISTWDETSKEPLPVPADLRDIKTGEGEHVVLIRFDMEDYYKKLNKRLIKKTLTIPYWLNELAVKKGVNFSQTLTQALREKLGV